MPKQKTIETKTPGRTGSLAAAVAMVLPLYTGCVNKDAVKPVQQPTQPAAAMCQPAIKAASKATARNITELWDVNGCPPVVTVGPGHVIVADPFIVPPSLILRVDKVDNEATELTRCFSLAAGTTGCEGHSNRIRHGMDKLREASYSSSVDIKSEKGERPGTAKLTFSYRPTGVGCVKKDTAAPASQQSAITEIEISARDRKVEVFGATAGSKFATSDHSVTVTHVDNDGISLLAEGPGHNIGFRVPYGRMCNDWPEVGVVRAEKGKRPNAANVTIRPSGSAIQKTDDSVTSILAAPGDTFERNGYQVDVISLTGSGALIHAVTNVPKHKHLLFQVPYGKDFAGAPEIGILRADKGCGDNTVKLEIR